MDYLPKGNIVVKNSWLYVSVTLRLFPSPGYENSLSVVEWWGGGCCSVLLSPHQAPEQPLTLGFWSCHWKPSLSCSFCAPPFPPSLLFPYLSPNSADLMFPCKPADPPHWSARVLLSIINGLACVMYVCPSSSLLLLLLYPGGHQREDPTWSRSRFLPAEGSFFLPSVALVGDRL